MKRKAFTLIEMLTVMAITVILFTIIVIPVIQSVNLVNLGSAYNQEQESARVLLDKISREISNSAGVRDNSGDSGSIAVEVPTGPGSPNPTTLVMLPYSKLDIVNYSQGAPVAAGAYVNPTTGKIDPTLAGPKGQVNLPVAPGMTITRYFIGLKNPLSGINLNPYYNPYDGLLMKQGSLEDNLYVVYKATVSPYIYTGAGYQVNANYFATDVNGNPILDDPTFMIPDGTAAKAARVQSWLNASVVQTQVSRFDMVEPVFNKWNQQVQYVQDAAGDFVPQLISLLQFKATQQSTEPATAQSAQSLGDENDQMVSVGSDVFRTKFGSWANPSLIINQVGSGTTLNILNQARSDGSVGFSEYAGASELFDVTDYLSLVSQNTPYAFTKALQASLTRNNWITGTPALLANFEPMYFDSSAGKVYGSFQISDVGLNALPNGVALNQPQALAGTQTTPYTNPDAGAVYGGAGYTINDAFNKAYATLGGNNQTAAETVNIKRIIDLRVTPNQDGTYGPLFPSQTANLGAVNVVVQNNSVGFPRAMIVPGSDVVYGPDQNPGPNYGNLVRYVRITQGDPGPDQYRINYANLPLPNFTTIFPPAMLAGYNANIYDPTNLASAMLQSQYSAGCIVLNSDPTQPLPNTVPFQVYYRFEFTQPTDTVSVNYQTRQVMNILLTVRSYPQATNAPNPTSVTLSTTATVRNFLRS